MAIPLVVSCPGDACFLRDAADDGDDGELEGANDLDGGPAAEDAAYARAAPSPGGGGDHERRGGVPSRLPFCLEELYLVVVGRPSASTAFATFATLADATIASSAKLSHRAFTTLGRGAPAPGDVVWANAATSLRQRRLRTWVVDFLVVPVCGAAWVSVLSYVQAWFASEEVRSWCGRDVAPVLLPFLRSDSVDGVDDDAALHAAAADFAAKTLATGVGLVCLLAVPWVAFWLSLFYEKPLSRADAEVRVFRRYVLFQFLWIYVSLISLSVEGLTEILARNPRDALELCVEIKIFKIHLTSPNSNHIS